MRLLGWLGRELQEAIKNLRNDERILGEARQEWLRTDSRIAELSTQSSSLIGQLNAQIRLVELVEEYIEELSNLHDDIV